MTIKGTVGYAGKWVVISGNVNGYKVFATAPTFAEAWKEFIAEARSACGN